MYNRHVVCVCALSCCRIPGFAKLKKEDQDMIIQKLGKGETWVIFLRNGRGGGGGGDLIIL